MRRDSEASQRGMPSWPVDENQEESRSIFEVFDERGKADERPHAEEKPAVVKPAAVKPAVVKLGAVPTVAEHALKRQLGGTAGTAVAVEPKVITQVPKPPLVAQVAM